MKSRQASDLNSSDQAPGLSPTRHLFFQDVKEANDSVHARKLLESVNQCDWYAVKKKMNKNPLLCFQQVSQDKEDQSKTISPLEYAFKQLNTGMWKMFLEKIQNNKEYLKLFLQQARNQIDHVISCGALEKAYNDFKAQGIRWLQNEIPREDIDKMWIILGAKQRELLPIHLLKRFCAENRPWGPNCAFDTEDDLKPMSSKAYSLITSTHIFIEPFEENQGLGVDFTLFRARNEFAMASAAVGSQEFGYLRLVVMDYDLQTFKKIYEVRYKDLSEQMAKLEILLQQHEITSKP